MSSFLFDEQANPSTLQGKETTMANRVIQGRWHWTWDQRSWLHFFLHFQRQAWTDHPTSTLLVKTRIIKSCFPSVLVCDKIKMKLWNKMKLNEIHKNIYFIYTTLKTIKCYPTVRYRFYYKEWSHWKQTRENDATEFICSVVLPDIKVFEVLEIGIRTK